MSVLFVAAEEVSFVSNINRLNSLLNRVNQVRYLLCNAIVNNLPQIALIPFPQVRDLLFVWGDFEVV